jgi:hypothetical protein
MSGSFTLEGKTKVSKTIKLPPPSIQKATPLFEVVQPNIDLQVSDIGLNRLGDYRLLIHYSTGNPNIEVVDKPLNFDVLVTGMYRPSHGPVIEYIKLVNKRFTLPARFVSLIIPHQWPHYIRGVQVWVTINPDKSIQEINYENNSKYIYLWSVEGRDCFAILPWPGDNNNPDYIFQFPWDKDYTKILY